MGLVMEQGSVLLQIDQMNKRLGEIVNQAELALYAEGELQNSADSLIGESYDSIREYFQTVHVPILQGIILYAEALMGENSSYRGCITGYLSGMNYVDEDALKEDRDNLRHQIEQVHNLMESYPGYFSHYMECLHRTLELIEKKLRQIENFVSSCAGLYQGLDSYMAFLHRGIMCIRDDHFSINNQSYQLDAISTDWLCKQEELWQNRFTNRYMQLLQTEYGFDEETVRIMGDVCDKLYEQYPEATQLEISWRFTRLMGGLVYDDEVFSEMKWDDVAGNALDKHIKIGSRAEANYFTETLGISETDYKMLRYQVRLQHMIVSEPNTYVMKENYDELGKDEKDRLKNWKEKCQTSTNLTFQSDEEFLPYWNERYNRYVGHGDYAHQQITTAAILAAEMEIGGELSNSYLGEEDKVVAEYAGWLGDAVIPPMTFGADDYKADLDASNIATLIIDRNISYREAAEVYYTRIEDGESRATIFLQNTELSYVKDKIYNESNIYQSLRLQIDNATTEEEVARANALLKDDAYLMGCVKEKSQNTYNFIRSLEEQASEMGSYE